MAPWPNTTCICWHHRGMHGPGVNHSDRKWLAVLHEWVRRDVNDGAPPADIWRDWPEEVRACPDHTGTPLLYGILGRRREAVVSAARGVQFIHDCKDHFLK